MHITAMATIAHNQPPPSLCCLLPWWVLARVIAATIGPRTEIDKEVKDQVVIIIIVEGAR